MEKPACVHVIKDHNHAYTAGGANEGYAKNLKAAIL